MKQIKQITFILTIVALCGLALSVQAQTTSVFTAGLEKPTKIISAGHNALLVAEAGTSVANTGRVSLVNRTTGARQTLVGGLPSGVNNLGGQPEPSGPSGLIMHGNTLYLTIGSGDALMNVGPGLESLNPHPSSPIFDSVLELNLPGNYEGITSQFTLSTANQTTLAGGGVVALTNANGQQMTIRMVANLPDSAPNPRPGFPHNIRASNVFGVEIFQNNLYVVDASFNLIYRVNIGNGQYSTFVTFPNKPNPLFPTLGPPTVEAVPDNIRLVGHHLLVPLLTGFPFVQNLSEVQIVNLPSGERGTFIPNLTSAIDVLRVGGNMYFTLEFSANQLANQPGRLKFFTSPNAAPVVVVSNLISPTSMARDETTGNIFVTEIFTGRIIRVQVL
jgi:hypothetical protein